MTARDLLFICIEQILLFYLNALQPQKIIHFDAEPIRFIKLHIKNKNEFI